MLVNYLKIAWRNLLKNRVFSLINILGLASGLATCLMIMLYIMDESGYDAHHEGADRVFRVASSVKAESWSAAPAPMAQGLRQDFPEVEESARLLKFPGVTKMMLTYESRGERNSFFETNGYHADSSFFRIFSYDFTSGHAKTVFSEPNSLLLSDKVAARLFGEEDPMGKVVKLGLPFGAFNYTVRGVFRSDAGKSHIPANFFISMNNSDVGHLIDSWQNWMSNNIFHTYVKLKPGTDTKTFESKLDDFLVRRAGQDYKTAGFDKHLFIQPVRDIYLHSDIGYEISANGSIIYLYIFGSVAGFLLLIACINFMNLTTARSEKRAREVGIRKAVGADKWSLVRQFLGESILLCLMAMSAAVLMVQMMLPVFNRVTGKALQAWSEPGLVFLIVGLTLLTGLLSGLYPAFYLSSFKPVVVLKGRLKTDFAASMIRKGLVVFQFSVSVVLMLGALVIWKQLDFLQHQSLGFEKNRKIVLPVPGEEVAANYPALKNELLSHALVESVSSGSTYPGIENIEDMLFYPEGGSALDKTDVRLSTVEPDYISTMGFRLMSGREFSRDITADSSGIIINEAAVKALGFTSETIIGKKINFELGKIQGSREVIGVLRNFNFESLHQPVRPFGMVTHSFGNRFAYVIATVKTTDFPVILTHFEKSWKKVNPGVPFSYSFLDQDFQKNYEKDRLTSDLVSYFTAIAVLIACLGLYGLAAFSAEQRTREIGVRKVLGAGTARITAMLSADFLKLVFIALAIGLPVAWWIMNRWLDKFSYKTDISVWVFLLTGAAALAIAALTIGYQSVKAAFTDPVKSLKSD